MFLLKKIYISKGEAITLKSQYHKRLRIHARGRYGILHKRYCGLRLRVVEVPEMPNEKKLGRLGWKNSTWDEWDRLRQGAVEEEVYEEEAPALESKMYGGSPNEEIQIESIEEEEPKEKGKQ